MITGFTRGGSSLCARCQRPERTGESSCKTKLLTMTEMKGSTEPQRVPSMQQALPSVLRDLTLTATFPFSPAGNGAQREDWSEGGPAQGHTKWSQDPVLRSGSGSRVPAPHHSASCPSAYVSLEAEMSK